MTTVHKFGGAALRDGPAIRRAAAILAGLPGPRIVVVSALEGVTDALLAAQRDALRDERSVPQSVAALRERHLAALSDAAPRDEAAWAAVPALFDRLERLLVGLACTQEVTPRLHDLVQSFGERLAAPIVAAALRTAEVPAQAFDAEAAGVASRGPFGNANPDLERLRAVCGERLGAAVAAGQVPVVTGYYGIDGNGHATLFGRGGSDYVAALVAYAVQAERLDLWKDVPGFLTADPRSVRQTTLVPELSYEEAAELAGVGAKVLHPRTVEPAQAAGIPVHIRHVADPRAPGSVVRAGVRSPTGLLRSVTASDGLAILVLKGPNLASTPGIGARVFTPLAAAGINVVNTAASQASFALLLAERDAAPASLALKALVGGPIQAIDVRPGRSLVRVVGQGLGERPGSAARILGALADAGVNVEMISLGASDLAIDLVVAAARTGDAVHAIHQAFLGPAKAAAPVEVPA